MSVPVRWLIVIGLMVVGLAAATASWAQQAPSVLAPPRDAVIAFQKGVPEEKRAVVRASVQRLLRALPWGTRVLVTRYGIEPISSPTVSEVVLGVTVAGGQSGESGGGTVPGLYVCGQQYACLVGWNTAGKRTATTSGGVGSILLNPGSETQSFNVGLVYHLRREQYDFTSMTTRLQQLLKAQDQSYTTTSLTDIKKTDANAHQIINDATMTALTSSLPSGAGWKLSELLAGDSEARDAETEVVAVQETAAVQRWGLYGRLGFATSLDFSDAAGTSASGGLVSPALGVQHILRPGKYTLGAEFGWTARWLAGDITAKRHDALRSSVIGTSATKFSGYELTVFANIDGKARPYVRYTNMPSSDWVSGFSGGQVVIGTDVFVAF